MFSKRGLPNYRHRFPTLSMGVGLILLALATAVGAIKGVRLVEELIDPVQDSGTPHKSDKDLIDNFLAHQREFDQLIKMVLKDKSFIRMDPEWTPAGSGVSQARIDEYRNLMNRLGILRGFSAKRGRKYVEFITSSQGFVTHGSMKGYLYTKRPPLQLDDNLDVVMEKGLYYGYRHIRGNWYLFFRKD